MAFEIRRVVTAHDAAGRSTIGSDAVVASSPGRFDARVGRYDPWSTDSMPPMLDGPDPTAKPGTVTPLPYGSIFRILEIPPDNDTDFHKTDTIDYYIILKGELYLLLEEQEVLCREGDVIVQRSTNHGWHNRSGKPCVFAEILIDAKGK